MTTARHTGTSAEYSSVDLSSIDSESALSSPEGVKGKLGHEGVRACVPVVPIGPPQDPKLVLQYDTSSEDEKDEKDESLDSVRASLMAQIAELNQQEQEARAEKRKRKEAAKASHSESSIFYPACKSS